MCVDVWEVEEAQRKRGEEAEVGARERKKKKEKETTSRVDSSAGCLTGVGLCAGKQKRQRGERVGLFLSL